MVAYQNTAAGGVDGVDVSEANSGGASGDAFTVVQSIPDALTYDTRSGLKAIKVDFDAGDTGGSVYAGWTLPGALTRVAGRVELYLDEPLTSPDLGGRAWRYIDVQPLFRFYSTAQTREYEGGPWIDIPTRLFVVTNGETLVESGDGVIPIGQWFRIEYQFDLASPYAWTVQVFHSLTSTTPAHAWSGNLAAPPIDDPDEAQYGSASYGHGHMWFRNPQVNDFGLPGPGPQPPSGPLMSTLTDAFPNINSSKWTTIGPVSSVGGALQLGDDLLTGYLTSADTYEFDVAQVRINAAGRGMGMWVDSSDSSDYLRIVIDSDTWEIRAEWFVSGSSGASDPEPYNVEDHKFLKIERHTDTEGVTFLTSHDGLEWTGLGSWGVPNDLFRNARAVLYGNLASSLDDFNIPVPVPPEEPDDLPDPFDPDITVPPIGVDPDTPDPAATCATLLQLIREFSAAVRRPVRIISPSVIELVDVNAPLPTGWTVADAADAYSRTTHELVAGERTMSTEPALLTLNASANLVADDVRLPVSSWRMPEQLPVYGLAAGLVKRVTYTFTPQHFSGAVEFHLRPVPASARRR